jgi:hypothetical protein
MHYLETDFAVRVKTGCIVVWTGKPKRLPYAANARYGCCASFAPCGAVCRVAISCCCGSARRGKKRGAFGFVTITLPGAAETVTRASFNFRVDKVKLRQAEQRDGHYLLGSNLTAEDPAVLWTRYIQLTNIDAAFRSLKSDLGLRPIHHRMERRVEAHIFVAFRAYCLQVTLKGRLQLHAPGVRGQSWRKWPLFRCGPHTVQVRKSG